MRPGSLHHLRRRNGVIALEAIISIMLMLVVMYAIFVLSSAYWNQVILGTSSEIAAQSAQTAYERSIAVENRGTGSRSIALLPGDCQLGVNLVPIAGSPAIPATAEDRAYRTAACVMQGSTDGMLMTGGAPTTSSSRVTGSYSTRTGGNYGFFSNDQTPLSNPTPPCRRTTIRFQTPFRPLGQGLAEGIGNDYRMGTKASIITGYSTGAPDVSGANALDRRCSE